MSNSSMRRLLQVTSALVVLAPLAAAAQQAAGGGLEEIVVTAQRREQRLEEVSAAITVLNYEAIQKAGVVSIMDLGQVATGLQFNFAGSIPGIALRGISTLVNGNGNEPNVAVYIDGFYDPSPISLSADLTNLEDVQVLKGPQGTLYGRNATGGAVMINTKGPSKTFTANFDAAYGRFNDKSFNGYVAGPLSDKLRYSIAGHYRDSDGHLKKGNPANPADVTTALCCGAPYKQSNFRTRFEADLSDDLTVRIGYNYLYSLDSRGILFTTYGHQPATLIPGTPLPQYPYGVVAYNRKDYASAMANEGQLVVNYKTPIGTLTSHTGITHKIMKNDFDFDGSFYDIAYSTIRFDQDTFQQALDYNINAIKNVDLLVGGMYYHDSLKHSPDRGTINYGLNFGPGTITRFRQLAEAWAVYLDATYHLTDKFSIGAGGRYSHDYKSMKFQTRSASTGAFSLGPLFDQSTWTKFTPRVTARYELAPRTDVYASWSRGFRGGNYNGSGPGIVGLPFAAGPENVDSYEVGFKTSQSKIRFQAAAFYYNYKNIQVSVTGPNPLCPQGAVCNFVTLFQNAPGAHVYGAEAELTANLFEGLTAHAGVELLHGRYTSFPNAIGLGVNATDTLNVASQTQDWSGQRMARAPDFTGNVGFDYETAIAYGTVRFTTNLNFSSRYAINNASLYGPLAPANQNVQRFTQNPYALLSAQLAWTDPSSHYTVTVYGSNLTNHLYRWSYNGGSFGDYGARAEPITYGAKVGVKF